VNGTLLTEIVEGELRSVFGRDASLTALKVSKTTIQWIFRVPVLPMNSTEWIAITQRTLLMHPQFYYTVWKLRCATTPVQHIY